MAQVFGLEPSISQVFSENIEARKQTFTICDFRHSSSNYLCNTCKAKGWIRLSSKLEVNSLILKQQAELYKRICSDCSGGGFAKEIGRIKVSGFSLNEIYSTRINKLQEFFHGLPQQETLLENLIARGFGDFWLALQAGELRGSARAQFELMQAFSLYKKSKGFEKNLFLVDNILAGLNDQQFDIIMTDLVRACRLGASIILVDSSSRGFSFADYLIQF